MPRGRQRPVGLFGLSARVRLAVHVMSVGKVRVYEEVSGDGCSRRRISHPPVALVYSVLCKPSNARYSKDEHDIYRYGIK